MRKNSFVLANLVSLALVLGTGCAPANNSDGDNGGSANGGSTGTGGSKSSGGSSGSSTGGSGGSSSSSGSGGSPSSSGTGGSTSSGSGGSVGSGGSTGAGGSSGSGGASAGSGGVSGSGGAGMPDASMSETGPAAGGPLAIMVKGLDMSPRFDVPVFPRSASNPTNMSPEISWTGMPEGTKSFAVSMIDTGQTSGMKVTPGGGTKAHWVLFDIPTNVSMLAPNLPHTVTLMEPAGSKTTRFAGGTGYFGPGAGSVNIYVITIWALKVPTLGATAGAASQGVYNMLQAQSLGKASFVAVGKQGGL